MSTAPLHRLTQWELNHRSEPLQGFNHEKDRTINSLNHVQSYQGRPIQCLPNHCGLDFPEPYQSDLPGPYA